MVPQNAPVIFIPKDFRMVLAEITYRLPDFPDLVELFIYEKIDEAPDFPELSRFLDKWGHEKKHTIKAEIFSVRMASRPLVTEKDLHDETLRHAQETFLH